MEQKRTRNLSPDTRERLSKLAKQRHAEGRMPGGFTGNPEKARQAALKRHENNPKRRIAKRVAEAAAEEQNAQDIINVFKDAIHPNQPMSIRLKGAQAWADIAQQEARFELQEDAASAAQHSREELLELLSDRLTSGPTANLLRRQIEPETGIVDAEVIEGHVSDEAA